MSIENPTNEEQIPEVDIRVENNFAVFVPEEFRTDPFGYFEREGRNIKSGEIRYDEHGVVEEDPTATKDFPVWKNPEGTELHTVGKKVNTTKSQIGKSGDPFYEYSIMEIAQEFGLPAPSPIAKASSGDEHLIVMEKIKGIRWTDEGMKAIHQSDLTEADKQDLLAQAHVLINELQQKYENIGLHRNWKLKDMIFDVDIPNKKVKAVIPTDWERTKIDADKLESARNAREKFDYYLKDFPLTSEDLQKPLLDVGAGTGGFVKYVRDVLGNKQAVGVERHENNIHPLSEGMVVADGLSLPFENDSFDIVLAHNYLPMFVADTEEMQNAINEILRVLKKDGKMLGDISTPESVLRSENEMQSVMGDKYLEKDKMHGLKRYAGAEDLQLFLQTLKETGYNIQTIKSHKNKTIVVIVKL